MAHNICMYVCMYVCIAPSSDRISEEVSVETEQLLKDKLLQLAATVEQVLQRQLFQSF